MMKKLLVLLLSAMMVFSLVACGGDDTTDGDDQQIENNVDENNDADADNDDADADKDDADASSDYTDEQLACIEEYEQMLADYNAAIEVAKETPELAEDTEFVDFMNEVSASIDTITDAITPETLDDELMGQIDVVIENAYIIINRIDVYSELLPILTVAGVGVDDEENTYWFACDEEETVGAMIILSADETEYVYCVGDMSVDENGVYTIVDEEGYMMSMLVEAVEGGLLLTVEDGEGGIEVGMAAAAPRDVIEMMLTIEETTENVNQ